MKGERKILVECWTKVTEDIEDMKKGEGKERGRKEGKEEESEEGRKRKMKEKRREGRKNVGKRKVKKG